MWTGVIGRFKVREPRGGAAGACDAGVRALGDRRCAGSARAARPDLFDLVPRAVTEEYDFTVWHGVSFVKTLSANNFSQVSPQCPI